MADVAPGNVTIGNARSAVTKIQTQAKGHGTFVSPTSGEILYIDKDHDEERYHSPMLTAAEAKEAHMRGLIDDPADAKEVDVSQQEPHRDQNAIGAVGAQRTAEFAQQDDEGGQGSGTLDSRGSTAWGDRERVEGGVDGFADGVRQKPADVNAEIDTESGDADAAPAGRRRRPAQAVAPTGE